MQRRRPLAVPDQVGIAIVLEDRHAVLFGEPQHVVPARFAQNRAGRILHGRDGVDVFRPDAAALEIVERRGERVHAHALAVERNADGVDAEPGPAIERALIGLGLGDDRIAARQQDAVDQIERLQRARGDQDLAGVAGDARGALELLRQKLAQAPVALRSAFQTVGRQRPAFARQHIVRRLDDRFERDLLAVVVAAGKIVFREAVEFDGRRRQPGSQQRREVERGHGRTLPMRL